MPETTYIRAITGALAEAMRADERVFVLGEDVAEGGPYSATDGLAEAFGTKRVIDTPISEAAITGVAIGAAGLLAAAIADPSPVVFVENKNLYFRKEEVPERVPSARIGEAVTLRAGRDVMIVALSRLVHDALAAAERLAAKDGIEAEVID